MAGFLPWAREERALSEFKWLRRSVGRSRVGFPPLRDTTAQGWGTRDSGGTDYPRTNAVDHAALRHSERVKTETFVCFQHPSGVRPCDASSPRAHARGYFRVSLRDGLRRAYFHGRSFQPCATPGASGGHAQFRAWTNPSPFHGARSPSRFPTLARYDCARMGHPRFGGRTAKNRCRSFLAFAALRIVRMTNLGSCFCRMG